MHIPKDRKLKMRASELRNNATPQENKLWYGFLKSSKYRFNRQRIIGEYIADFYCAKLKLVIEVDGNHHYTVEQKLYDEQRTAFLNALQIRVIRLTNEEVDHNFSKVCDLLNNYINDINFKHERN